MTPRGMSRVVVIVTLVLLSGCSPGIVQSTQLSALDPATTQIEYRFNDSSVPPEYHRSFTVNARSGEASIVVDSYGEVLNEESSGIDDQTWRMLVAAAADLDVASTGESEGCTGGTSRELRISEADAPPVLDVRVAVCGGNGQGQAEHIDTYVAPLFALFDMESLVTVSN